MKTAETSLQDDEVKSSPSVDEPTDDEPTVVKGAASASVLRAIAEEGPGAAEQGAWLENSAHDSAPGTAAKSASHDSASGADKAAPHESAAADVDGAKLEDSARERAPRESSPREASGVARTNSRSAPVTSQTVGIPLELPFSPGDVIAEKYEIIKVIGSGGMGYVVSATHVELGHQVALKFLRPELLVHRDLVARFAKEARTAVMIKSEHVARVFDVGTLPDAGPFIAMELLEGQDLGRLVSERGALPMEAAIDYILQACEALATAHSLGIVHRDIKPENLFLSRNVPGVDVIKVLDFGISKLEMPEPPQRSRRPTVRSTSAVGSPTYMSPEQVRAVDTVDARADVWALGCVLYELLSGAPAFDAPSLTQLAAKILESAPAPLRSIKPELPNDLEWVIGHCLGKDPNKRFQNVGELAAALRPFAAPRSRIIADRCRYVLDPSTSFDDVEMTGPVSWNGVSTGLGTSSASIVPSAPPAPGIGSMARVTVAARRVVVERKRFAPLAGVAALGLVLGVWRAFLPGSTAPVMSSQTFLTAPGRGSEPTVAEALGTGEQAEGVTGESVAPSADMILPPVESAATAVPDRAPRAAPRLAPRRAPASALARPKAASPAASSTAAEPDVGF
jgi:serine/threonine-protein kinase